RKSILVQHVSQAPPVCGQLQVSRIPFLTWFQESQLARPEIEIGDALELAAAIGGEVNTLPVFRKFCIAVRSFFGRQQLLRAALQVDEIERAVVNRAPVLYHQLL